MKILIDEDMVYARELFSCLGEVKIVPGRKITQAELNDIDALMIRSVTKVNEELLTGTPVKFVGTATAGIDHVDYTWLKKVGIEFSAALGCNSIAVVEYIISALLMLSERDGFSLRDRTVGIVGVGNVGGLLQQYLTKLGVRTLLCDPPRADRGEEGDFISLNDLVKQVDILTFHTPLSKDGPYKTLHLVNESLIKHLQPGSILLNTCRGPVIDNAVLLMYLKAGHNISVVLDVWETEPNINIALLKCVDIGTPHIAGSTLEGKSRGTVQIFKDYSAFIGNPQQAEFNILLPKPKFSHITLHGHLDEFTLKRLVHLIYDVRHDDALLRKITEVPDGFDKLRKNYLERREWSSIYVVCDDSSTATLLRKLGFNTIINR